MIRRIGRIAYKPISRISPSQFTSMRNCSYKSVLAEAFDKCPLLPISASGYFGTVLHKLLEMIASRKIKNVDELQAELKKQCDLVEATVIEQGFRFLTPLQKNVTDFGVKVVQLKKQLTRSINPSSRSSGLKYFPEKWIESKNKAVGGKMDLVIEGDQIIEILDFKTGAIHEQILDDEGEVFFDVKEDYQDQLKLYAFLYFESYGIFPTKLTVVDLANQRYEILSSPSECQNIFSRAEALLVATNLSIETGHFIANPTEKNCKYCLYRPACNAYTKVLSTAHVSNDVSGIIVRVTNYQNGNVNCVVKCIGDYVTITGLDAITQTELAAKIGNTIKFFNLRRGTTENVFSATKTTMIYEQEG